MIFAMVGLHLLNCGPQAGSKPTAGSTDLNAAGGHSMTSSGMPLTRSSTALTWARKGSSCRSEEHTSELQSRGHLVCRLLLEKKKKNYISNYYATIKIL